MKVFDKRCPECDAKITFRNYLGLKSLAFACRSCGAKLRSYTFNRNLWQSAGGVIFIALPISQALCDARWWWALLPGLALSTLWGYAFLQPRSAGAS